jgi:hypothetical protein
MGSRQVGINAADLAAAAYGRKPPRYPVIPATLGLAVAMLMNRNTAAKRALWLVDPEISAAMCDVAEAFSLELTGRPAAAAWRGGALASLRTLAGSALHELAEPWPHTRDGAEIVVPRLWIEDGEDYGWQRREQPPFRAEVLRRVAALAAKHHRDPVAAGSAAEREWEREPTYDEKRQGRHTHRPTMCAWDCCHERVPETRWLLAELAGRDMIGEREAGRQARLAEYRASKATS